MPVHRVTDPQGIVHLVSAPEGATPEQIVAYAKKMAGGVPSAAPSAPASPVVPGNEGVVFKDGSGKPSARFGDFLKPVFGDHNPIAETYDAFVDPLVPDGSNRTPEEQAWLKQRPTSERASDAAAFVASLPVRMLSGGGSGQDSFGLGEGLKRLGMPEWGDALSKKEENFAAANRPQLEAVQKAGDLAMGLPNLPFHGVPAPQSFAAKAGTLSKAGERATARIGDAAAMKRLGIEPFGPALTDSGVASAVEQLSKVPILGNPLANKMADVVEQTRDAAANVAKKYGSEVDPTGGARQVHQGLDRFFNASPEDVLGFHPEDLPQTPESLKKLWDVVKTPSKGSSGQAKAAAMYELAWRMLPEDMRNGKAVLDKTRLTGGTTAFRDVIMGVLDRNLGMINKGRLNIKGKVMNSKELADLPPSVMPANGGLLGDVVRDTLTTNNMNRTLQDTRNLRSHVRRLSAGMADTEKNTLSISDNVAMQKALGDDFNGLLLRNADAYRQAQDHTTAGKIDMSSKMFKKADVYYADLKARELKLKALTGADRMEGVAGKLVNAAKTGSKGDIQLIHQVRSVVRPQEWDDFAASIIHDLGAPRPGARGNAGQAGFSLQSATSNWNAMSDSAKRALFRDGKNPERAQALDDLARTVKNLSQYESLANNSRTATNAIAIGTPLLFGGLAFLSNWQIALGGAAGAYGMSKFLASPHYVHWLTRTAQLRRKGAKRELMANQWRKLKALALQDPELGRQVIAAIGQMQTEGEQQPSPNLSHTLTGSP